MSCVELLNICSGSPKLGSVPCLCGACAQDSSTKGPQLLQAGGSNIPHHEDPGVAGPCPTSPSGEVIHGPVAVCISAWHWSGPQCHLPHPVSSVSPKEAWGHSEKHALWFLQCFQYHTALTPEGQAGARRSGPPPPMLDYLTSHPQ